MAGNYNTISHDFPRSSANYAAVTLHVSGDISDYSLKENSFLFNKVRWARELVIRNSAPVTVKFNSVDNDPIDLFTNEGINMSGMPVGDIIIGAGDGAIIRIWIVGWN
jgi:hypothetical protein